MLNQFDSLVVGAGIWGCTLARRLAEAGHRVLVLEKRPVVGGNCRCEIDAQTGIEIHSYGSHIFHTHNRQVWDFVRRFTDFNGYQHKVLANYKGKTYHLPLGLTLINKFFDVELKPGEVESFLTEERRRAIFDAFFRGYTSKQWGKAPEEIDPSIIKRVPVRSNYDTNYYNDYWQGIPSDGYNALFERLLDHESIEVRCNTPFNLSDLQPPTSNLQPQTIYYSGPIDELFDYKFGALPWRTLRFEAERLQVADFQGTSVVNYTDIDVPYTRIHEFRHYHPESTWRQASNLTPETIIMREYSKAWEPGDEPYYPINNPESAALLARYQEEVEKFNHRSSPTPTPTSSTSTSLVLGGRLGLYKYLDMDQAMAAALEVGG